MKMTVSGGLEHNTKNVGLIDDEQPSNTESARSELFVGADRYYAKVIYDADWSGKNACLRLRHSYFAQYRGWTTHNDLGNETDHYDPFCQHLAVFQNDQILAYMRLLPWQENTGFMLEHDFACLLTDKERDSIVHERSAEISRLVVANTFHTNSADNAENSDQPTAKPNPFAHLHALYLLFRLFFHTARQNDIETFYIVVEPPTLRLLQRKFGIPFIPLGNTYTFPDGTVTQAAFTTLSDTERSIAAKFPERYEWYRQTP